MRALKRIFLGRPLASEDLGHTLLPKILALPVFASDALSSVAYATEEILHVLILAGTATVPAMHLGKSIPIAGAVAFLMTIVIVSYRQTVKAYPRGGGSYIVSRENLGQFPGLVAAAALLVDYVLTVAVSIAAGAFAVASLAPSLLEHRVGLALIFVAFVTIMNLRGTRESGSIFAVPTYAFIVAVLSMLAVGLSRCVLSECPVAHAPHGEVEYLGTLTLFLLLRAFASGATALTGVEAIADGVPAFRGRRPADQANNAAITLGLLGVIAITMFLGITVLANLMKAVPSETKSVLAQLADASFGGGFGFVFVQIATAAILVMAANTAYQDFPRLASILAKDRFMPRQFINRGDRLVFSNGIVVLASMAALLIVAYNAEVTRLIQLYVLGVFTSFTLSQAGMVLRWTRLKPPGWRRNAIFNGIGATTTGIVFFVVLWTKFMKGAWIVVVTVIILVGMFKLIHSHYRSVSSQLRRPEGKPHRSGGTRVLVLAQKLDAATLRALGYAIAMRPLEVRAVHVGRDQDGGIRSAWEARQLRIPLHVIPGDGDLIEPMRQLIATTRQEENEFVTIVVPESYRRAGKRQAFRSRRTLLLKASLLFERRVVVTDVPTIADDTAPELRGAITPTRIAAVVLVSAVHNATLRALEYARSLSPTDLRAVTFNVDPDETDGVLRDWIENVDTIPLEAIDSPYREITKPLIAYARRLREGKPDLVVSIIVPEFVAKKWWHHFLHNQTALAIKYALQFEPGVVLTSVPFHLE